MQYLSLYDFGQSANVNVWQDKTRPNLNHWDKRTRLHFYNCCDAHLKKSILLLASNVYVLDDLEVKVVEFKHLWEVTHILSVLLKKIPY